MAKARGLVVMIGFFIDLTLQTAGIFKNPEYLYDKIIFRTNQREES